MQSADNRPLRVIPRADGGTERFSSLRDKVSSAIAGRCIALEREHLYLVLGWRRGDATVEHPPTGYEVRAGRDRRDRRVRGRLRRGDPPGPRHRSVGRVLVRPFLQPPRRGWNAAACRRPRQRRLRRSRRRPGQLRLDLYHPPPDPAATTPSGRAPSRILTRAPRGDRITGGPAGAPRCPIRQSTRG